MKLTKKNKINVTLIQNKCFKCYNLFNSYQIIIMINNDVNLIIKNIKIKNYNY